MNHHYGWKPAEYADCWLLASFVREQHRGLFPIGLVLIIIAIITIIITNFFVTLYFITEDLRPPRVGLRTPRVGLRLSGPRNVTIILPI